MSPPTTILLLRQPAIKFFPSSPSSSLQLKRVKPFSLHRFSASDFSGPVVGEARAWSPHTMTKSSTKVSAIRDRDEEEGGPAVFEQESLLGSSSDLRARFMAEGLEATLNRLSKWIVAGLFGAILLCRHDVEAVWFAAGSVINSIISVTLKRILNQERPVANLRSDPGMPSSHAQSIFFIFTFAIISFLEWMGINEITLITSVISLAFASYLSWLRVSQQLHTISQIVVGAAVGTIVSILWYWSWEAIVMEAFESFLWVRVLIILGAAGFCLGFVVYAFRHWLKDER